MVFRQSCTPIKSYSNIMSKKHQTDRRNGERFVSEESGGSGEFDLSRGLSRLMQIYKKGRTDQDAGNKSCGLQKI